MRERVNSIWGRAGPQQQTSGEGLWLQLALLTLASSTDGRPPDGGRGSGKGTDGLGPPPEGPRGCWGGRLPPLQAALPSGLSLPACKMGTFMNLPLQSPASPSPPTTRDSGPSLTVCPEPFGPVSSPGVPAARLPRGEEGQAEGGLLTGAPPLAPGRHRGAGGRRGGQRARTAGPSCHPASVPQQRLSVCLSVSLCGAACPARAGGRLQGAQLLAGPCHEPNTVTV